MVLLTLCIPCRAGNHDRCFGTIQAAPPGMLGGMVCNCECRKDKPA